MSMLRLVRLRLQDFRNYDQLTWELDPGESGRIVVLTGANGSGKTNLLEAVSLLAPGRGLRGAHASEFPRRSATGNARRWGIAARLETPRGMAEIGTGSDGERADRRAFLLDGVAPRSQAEVAARIAMLWLTPQMDLLFQEPASGRRRFLDRLVYALEPGHASEVAAHDAALAQRARLLASATADVVWLEGLEDAIARHAVAVTAARLSFVSRLNQALDGGAAAGFPPAQMALVCAIGERLRGGSALAVEDWLRVALAKSRITDAQSGSVCFGAHRADMNLADVESGRSAGLASTGQRKALLIGVVLGHAALIGSRRGMAPILLLDEPMVHLDPERRRLLCDAIHSAEAQFLLTGTDVAVFQGLGRTAGFLRANGGALHSSDSPAR